MTSAYREISEKIYKGFLEQVIIEGVFAESERELTSGALSDDARKQVLEGRRRDTRVPYLNSISGKGGWHPSPSLREKYSQFRNVSLIDHLTSVVRGALMFGTIDLVAAGVSLKEIEKRMALVVAIAFAHDLDKAIGKSRQEDIQIEDVDAFLRRYRLNEFLATFGVTVSPEVMLALISEVELTRGGYFRPGMSISNEMKQGLKDSVYVRLADQMDSTFLNGNKNISDALALLSITEGFASTSLKMGWRVIEINDPNSPFLLDTLLAHLSQKCIETHEFPPLIELHHGGRLTCIVPEDGSDKLVASALNALTDLFGGNMRIDVNARGTISILDSRGDLNSLRHALTETQTNVREKLVQVRESFKEENSKNLDEFFLSTDFTPKWPDPSYNGKLVPMWYGCATEDLYREFHFQACLVSVLLSCQDAPPKSGIIQSDEREAQLVSLLHRTKLIDQLPEWLANAHASDRRTVLSAWAAAKSLSDPDLEEELTGSGGLLDSWLLGTSARKGLVEMIESSSDKIAGPLKSYLNALIDGKTVVADDEQAVGRCHFTNMPVPKSSSISLKDGLYALNVSAFSGREGRPEYFHKAESETLVSPIAMAEHKLRQISFKKNSQKRDIPVFVSCPTTAGLFGALAFDGQINAKEMGLLDFLRADMNKGQTYSDRDGYAHRLLIGRYEEFPSTLVGNSREIGQIGFIRSAMEMALRLGRPVHVFRGLPTPMNDFVYFDTMPVAIEKALGGRGLRLEQIKGAIKLLRGIEAISQQSGFGLELAMQVADPDTRFSALCGTYARSENGKRQGDADTFEMRAIHTFAVNTLKEMHNMTNEDKNIVAFAEAMANYQKSPGRDDGANVVERGFRIALEQAELMSEAGMGDDIHLIAAVAGSIKADFERGGLSFRKFGDDTLMTASEIFVTKVWNGAFGGTSPSSRLRRSAFAVYRWSLLRAISARFETTNKTQATA